MTFRIVRWVVLTLFAIYFALPLISMFEFSTRGKPGEPRQWENWKALVQNEDLRASIITSLLLALFTVVLMLLILVPTMVWVRLRVRRASRLIEFLCLLPLTIPALVIVVGIADTYSWVTYFLGDSPLVLTFAYVVLVLPYAYRSIDGALAAIDVNTLAEAARSLGAGWPTVIGRIVVPNIVPGLMSAAFISVALVLGEFTFASLLHFDTMPVVIAAIGKSEVKTAVAASLASIIFTSLLLVLLSALGERRRTSRGTTS